MIIILGLATLAIVMSLTSIMLQLNNIANELRKMNERDKE